MRKSILILSFAIVAMAGISLISCTNSDKKTESTEQTKQISESKYQCPMKCEGDKTYDKAGSCPVCKMNLKKLDAEVVHFQCPMKCEGDKTYNNPGNCPECKMKLKKIDSQ